MSHKPGSGIREMVLSTRIGGRQVREILYPSYVRLYPYLYWMRRFEFDGRVYEYMFHPYATTLRGERIVEIPIALRELALYEGRRILEVGNVLSHYVPCRHLIVDKYEVAPGCVNQDILEFRPPHALDFIVSISTVEHIGWNEYERSPERAIQALQAMAGMLAPGGTMMVTVPWGGNPALDEYLRSPDCLFTRLRYMKRTSGRNTWAQTDASACAGAKYGEPFPFANVLVIGYATQDGQARAANPASAVG